MRLNFVHESEHSRKVDAHVTNTLAKTLPLNRHVRLLAANEDGLVALDKPVNLMSHPNRSEDIPRSLLRASYDYPGEYYFWEDEDGQERRVWLLNRLDSPTSGVILLGLNPEIAEIVKAQFSTHKVIKTYYALVWRLPKMVAGSWVDTLRKDIYNNGHRVMKKGWEVKAKTRFQVMGKPIGGFPIALLKLMPITGRTHQLRVQCSKHGHCIIGDRAYGSVAFNKEVALETDEKRMMLHSMETVVSYAYKGKVRKFRAKSTLPRAFHALMRFRPGTQPMRAARTATAEQNDADQKKAEQDDTDQKETKKDDALADRRFKTA